MATMNDKTQPNLSSSGTNTFDEVRSPDFASRLSDIRDRASQINVQDALGQAQDLASTVIRQTSTFLKTEQGRTTGIVAMVAAAGLVGYLLGRNSSSSDLPSGILGTGSEEI